VAIEAVIDLLACPNCGGGLRVSGRVVGCDNGHRFDVAREGYVSFLTGSARSTTADTPAMVAARRRFLATGAFDPLIDEIAEAVTSIHSDAPCAVLDAGGGTGEYLGRVLADDTRRTGVLLDVSKHACKAAARISPCAGVVAADLWGPLPVGTGCIDVVLDVFAPRNPAEFARVLRRGGHLVVVTPEPDHLAPLAGDLGTVSVDPRKEERLGEQLASRFALARETRLRHDLLLTREQAVDALLMGPTGAHRSADELTAAVAGITAPIPALLHVRLGTYRPVAQTGAGT
jgi:23S rRNA (guanine745-N1)-methyltransferase